ncbi:prepilin-type N-terminal cleavage/methylation domain-containing protein [Coraliomargarita sp. W4R72]
MYLKNIPATFNKKNKTSAAFTLIELLVVIAIIGILASILIPVASNVRESAQQTKCASNLRQLAVASVAYASDNHGSFPSLYSDVAGEGVWIDQIAPYAGGDGRKRVFEIINCPSAEYIMEFDGVRTATYSYGWNPRLIPDSRAGDDGEVTPATRLINVRRPSETILLADTTQPEARKGWGKDYFATFGQAPYDPATAEDFLPDSAYTGFSTRHGDRGNAAFVDGHVESFAIGEMKQKHVYTEN